MVAVRRIPRVISTSFQVNLYISSVISPFSFCHPPSFFMHRPFPSVSHIFSFPHNYTFRNTPCQRWGIIRFRYFRSRRPAADPGRLKKQKTGASSQWTAPGFLLLFIIYYQLCTRIFSISTTYMIWKSFSSKNWSTRPLSKKLSSVIGCS